MTASPWILPITLATDTSGSAQIRTIDPQVIFIIGHKDREIPRTSTSADNRTKRDTLERFSRNNRNISIVTYDELYRRAYHIVHGAHPPAGSTVC